MVFLKIHKKFIIPLLLLFLTVWGKGEGGEVENIGEGRKSMKEKGGEKRRARKEIVVIFSGGRSAK